MARSCVICGEDDADGTLIVKAPCGSHWVCASDVAAFFEYAADDESMFPPNCCDQIFLLEEYEQCVPFDISWAYQMKVQGEYAVLAKFRVYCANASCAKFLHPSSHTTDTTNGVKYAICDVDDCKTWTCISCKKSLNQSLQSHVCQQSEDDEKFRQTAAEKGYQECFLCGAIVELAEACNHITCECGTNFCYVCGKEWPGTHGCPPYGTAKYDEDGYNQDGFHRDTGLNRNGLTRLQEIARFREEEEDDDVEDDENDTENEEWEEWEVLRHLDVEARATINVLEGRDRRIALDAMRVHLFETLGITFEGQRDDEDTINDPDNRDDEDDEGDYTGDEDHEDVDPDNGHENEPAPTSLDFAHDNANLQGEGQAVETRPTATHFQPNPLTLPPIHSRPPTPMEIVDPTQEDDEGEFQRPEWFPPVGGYPDDEEL